MRTAQVTFPGHATEMLSRFDVLRRIHMLTAKRHASEVRARRAAHGPTRSVPTAAPTPPAASTSASPAAPLVTERGGLSLRLKPGGLEYMYVCKYMYSTSCPNPFEAKMKVVKKTCVLGSYPTAIDAAFAAAKFKNDAIGLDDERTRQLLDRVKAAAPSAQTKTVRGKKRGSPSAADLQQKRQAIQALA
jgi:hypothetical protein